MDAENDGKLKNEAWEANLRAQGYPKRMVVDRRNKHWEFWQKYFDRQFEDECKRLNIPVELSLF